MTQTLRRELRKKFEGMTVQWLSTSKAITDVTGDQNTLDAEIKRFAEILSDAALEVSAIAKQEKKAEILQNAGADWNAAFGGEAQTERGRRAQLEQNAVIAFERAFGGISWAEWWGGRKEWDKLREFITAKFAADPECFRRYAVEWLPTSYGKGMTALQIKRKPADFPTAWAAFEQDTQVKKTDETRPIYGVITT